MNPEHKLLKFVILPVVLVLLGYLAWFWVESPHPWYDTLHGDRYYVWDAKYTGSTDLSNENLGKYIGTVYQADKLKGIFTACDGKKSAWWCSSYDPKKKLTSESKFRVASVSKVITSLAVLQLADEGKLSLEDKVEKYIKYEKHFPKSPTVEDLLLHTAGFDNNNAGFFYKTKEEKPSLEEFVYRKPIVQVIEPHKVFDYTNIAFDMAGLIVQKVSGQKFEDYCTLNIFKPLEMSNTGFDESHNVETGLDALEKPVERFFVGGTPSAGLVTTAKDMGNLINCLLNGGKFKDKVVFGKKAIESAFTVKMDMGKHLRLARTPVFWSDDGGKTIFNQTGKMLGFSSELIIEKGKAGVFTACAGEDAGQYLGSSIYNNFFNPPLKDGDGEITPAKNKIDAKPINNPQDYQGEWINMFGWNRNNAAKIANAAFYNLNVSVDGDTMNINYTDVKNIDDENFGNEYWNVRFIRDDSGQIKYLQTGQDAHVRAPWYMGAKFLTIYGLLSLLAFLLICLQGLFGLIMRAFAKEKTTIFDKLLRLSMVTIGALNLAFFFILYVTFTTTDLYRFGFKPEFSWYAVFTLPIIGVALTIPAIIGVVNLWRKKLWGWQARFNATAFLVVQCLFVWSLAFWNLLGYNF